MSVTDLAADTLHAASAGQRLTRNVKYFKSQWGNLNFQRKAGLVNHRLSDLTWDIRHMKPCLFVIASHAHTHSRTHTQYHTFIAGPTFTHCDNRTPLIYHLHRHKQIYQGDTFMIRDWHFQPISSTGKIKLNHLLKTRWLNNYPTGRNAGTVLDFHTKGSCQNKTTVLKVFNHGFKILWNVVSMTYNVFHIVL